MSPLPHPIESPPPLESGAVSIRAMHQRDARTLQELLASNRRWLEPWEATFPGGGGAEPGSVSMKPVVRALQKQQREGAAMPFVIAFDGEVVGQLTISDISGGAVRSGSIGYWVAEKVAGRGVTPTAVALAIEFAMNMLNLHRIEICIRPENGPSLRVVEKLGMRYEGRRKSYIHIAGKWCDHDCFAVTAEEIPDGMLARLGAAPLQYGH